MPTIYSLTLPNSPQAARDFRAVFGEFMTKVGVAAEDRDRFLLSMSEVVTNLSVHPDPAPESVRVTFRKFRADWELEIADDGPSFTNLAEKLDGRVDFNRALHENGMGLFLVASQFPRLRYEEKQPPGQPWNCLFLTTGLTGGEQGQHILLVDDDPSYLKVLEAYLRRDYSVSAFADASEALAFLDEHDVDLIVSDINMAGVDGYQFRQSTRQASRAREVPFVFLTGVDSPQNLDRAINLSIDDYLTKPVGKSRLLTTMKRVLRRSADIKNQLGDRLDRDITLVLEPSINSEISGFDFAVVHEAASAGGGDLLVDKKLENGHLLVLADLMGHGEQAKFFAHALAGYVSGIVRAVHAELSPGTILSLLSDAFMNDDILKNTFATAVAVHVSAEGQASMAAAGHPPPLIVSDNAPHVIDVGGPLLGLIDEPEYTETVVSLDAGDRIILYTDGISESGRVIVDCPSELIGDKVGQLAALSNRQLAGRILNRALSRSGSPLDDDATVVVIGKNHD